MPYGRLTKYQLSARVRALRAEHRYLAGRPARCRGFKKSDAN